MKNLKPTHYIFILFLVLLSIFTLIKTYPEWFGDLIKFPFDAGVWGTFSDFTILLITAVTLVSIVLTIKAQNKAIALQQIALEYQKFETEAIKSSSKPDFQITFRSIDFGWPSTPSFNLNLTVVNADIYDLNIVIENDQCEFEPLDAEGDFTKGKKFTTTIKFGIQISMLLYFKDFYGTPYRKKITFYKDGTFEEKPTTIIRRQ